MCNLSICIGAALWVSASTLLSINGEKRLMSSSGIVIGRNLLFLLTYTTTELFRFVGIAFSRKGIYYIANIMRNRFNDLPIRSTSLSTNEKSELTFGGHFRWQSVKQFVYVAHAFSSSTFSFDMFSKVSVVNAHLFEYITYTVLIGISYMFMDFFIKQYTRRLDTCKTLNPLLRGVSFGILMQTAVWSLVHASNLADSTRFFMVSMNRAPAWTKCYKVSSNRTCLSSQEIIMSCRNEVAIDFYSTSAHYSYSKQFSNYDRNSLSVRLFVIAIVWICNFFVASISDIALLKVSAFNVATKLYLSSLMSILVTQFKLFKFSFLFGTFSTAFILIFLMFSTKCTGKAFYEIMNIKSGFDRKSINLATDPFGVGLIGVYDFGIMSPYMMVDNAAIVFTVVFIASAFARSLIVRVLYMKLVNCVNIKAIETPHYLLFAILPLSTEFMDAHKIFVLYIYSYLMAALVACLALFTTTISKLLHSEFRSVKNIYIIGLLCFLGFTLSLPLSIFTTKGRLGVLYGLNTCTLYLGGFKVVIVMWVYGVQKFATDIQFWLGFKPTRFWMFLWVMLPVFISVFLVDKIIHMANFSDPRQKNTAVLWIGFTVLIVLIFHLKIITKYIFRNNLVGVFKSNSKYGPPDVEDRKRRRNFDVLSQSRRCTHKCVVLDDKYVCNHLPLIYKRGEGTPAAGPSSDSSLTNIYHAVPSKKRVSSIIDVSVLHIN